MVVRGYFSYVITTSGKITAYFLASSTIDGVAWRIVIISA